MESHLRSEHFVREDVIKKMLINIKDENDQIRSTVSNTIIGVDRLESPYLSPYFISISAHRRPSKSAAETIYESIATISMYSLP